MWLALKGGGGGGVGPIFFFGGFGRKKIIANSYFTFFYVYMSKCRKFEGLSTGIFTWTIPNHTIKLQLHLIIRIKIKYLSIQLLIRGTCRGATEGLTVQAEFPYLTSLFF